MRLNSLVKPLLITGFMLAGTAQAAPDAREVLEASPVDDIVAQYPEMMSRGIQDALKPEQLEEVHGWYQTPVAGKIAEAEIAASAPAAWPEIRSRAEELNKRYQGTAREKLFDRFDAASRATESAVDTTIAVQLGLGAAMAALSRDSVHHEKMRERLESQRPALRGMVGQQVYDGYLFTYRDISNQEMNLYLDFL